MAISDAPRGRKILARLYVDSLALKDVHNQLWLQEQVATLICEVDKGEHRTPSKLLIICEAEELYQERLRNL